MMFLSLCLTMQLLSAVQIDVKPTMEEASKKFVLQIDGLSESSTTKTFLDLQKLIGQLDGTTVLKFDNAAKLDLQLHLLQRVIVVKQEYTKNNPVESVPDYLRRGGPAPPPGVDIQAEIRRSKITREKNRAIGDKIATYDGLIDESRFAVGFVVVIMGRTGTELLNTKLENATNEDFKNQILKLQKELESKDSIYSKMRTEK